MAVSDWSTTPASNTALGSIVIGDNVMTPGTVDNAFRELMAQAKTKFNSVDAELAEMGTLYPRGSSPIYAYGDSITVGVGASPEETYAWAVQFANALGITLTNRAVSGGSIMDWGTLQMNDPVADDAITTILPGFNDQHHVGDSTAKLEAYRRALYAAVAHAAIPDSRKTFATATGDTGMVYTGSWTDSAVVNEGKVTISEGAKVDTTAYGSVIYVCLMQQPGCGIASVKIDGEEIDGSPFDLSTDVGNGGSVSTIDYMPYLVRIEHGRGGGAHLVTIEKTDATSKPVALNWVAGAGEAATGNARVFCGNTLRFNTSIGTTMPVNYQNYTNTGNNSFCAIALEVCSVLASDGLNVHFVDAATAWDVYALPALDGIHPNNAGMTKIAEAYLQAAKGLNKPAHGAVGKGVFTDTDQFLVSVGKAAPVAKSTEQVKEILGGGAQFGAYQHAVYAPPGGVCHFLKGDTTATNPIDDLHHPATTGDNLFFRFYTEASPTLRGTLGYNRGAGTVAITSTSDPRAKEFDGHYAGAGKSFDRVPVHLARLHGTEMWRPMLTTHELEDAGLGFGVLGKRDAVDEATGEMIFQQYDPVLYVPFLWAVLAETRKENAELRARLNAAGL